MHGPLVTTPARKAGGRWAGWSRAISVPELALLAVWLVAVPVAALALYHIRGTVSTDIREYHRYALAFWTGHPLFHALPREYPPLTMVLFSLTLAPPLGDYQAVFVAWMSVLGLLGYLAFRRFATRRQAITFVGYLVLGAAGTVASHFDIVPALLTVGALWAVTRRHFHTGYALLALGILLKLYPAFLVPVVAIQHWRSLAPLPDVDEPLPGAEVPSARNLSIARRIWSHRRAPVAAVGLGLGICAGIVLAGFLAALAINPEGTLSIFRYASDRPLEVESTPATLLWLGTYLGHPAHYALSYGSYNYVGPLDGVLKPLSTVAVACGCMWVYWRQAHGRLTVGQACLAALCMVLAANKIFSPQYLLWVLPFVAVEVGWDHVWILICLLTTLDFPIIYRVMPTWAEGVTWQFMVVLAARNALMLYAAIRASGVSAGTTLPASAAGERIEAVPALVGESKRR